MSTRFLRGSVIHNRHDPLDKGLVGEWRFDRNTGLMLPDYSGYANFGTIDTAVTWVTTPFGIGLDFAINGSVNCGAAADISEPITILAYVTVDSIGATRTIAARRTGSPYSYQFRIAFDGKLDVLTTDGSTVSTLGIAGGETAFVGVSIDTGGIPTFFKNSFSNTVAAVRTITTGNATHFDIGAISGGGAHQFDGKIYWVGVYNRALTANEVGARYQLVRKRMQTFGGEWSLDRYAVVVSEEEGLSIPVAMHHYMHKVFG